MKKKTIIFSIICIFILTAFSGCTKQNAITNSKFEEKAKEEAAQEYIEKVVSLKMQQHNMKATIILKQLQLHKVQMDGKLNFMY